MCIFHKGTVETAIVESNIRLNYPKFDGFIGNFFQINVDTAGIINCFHSVVRVYNLTQLQCSAGVVIFKISGDILNLCMRNYRRINAYKPQIIQGSSVQFQPSSVASYSPSALTMCMFTNGTINSYNSHYPLHAIHSLH